MGVTKCLLASKFCASEARLTRIDDASAARFPIQVSLTLKTSISLGNTIFFFFH